MPTKWYCLSASKGRSPLPLRPTPGTFALLPCQSVELQGHGYADKANGPIALIGTGHTAIDALFRLTSVDPNNREVVLLSRHGLLPKAHRTLAQAPVPTGFPSYLQAVRC